jgi:hypothetical protein
MYHDVGGLLIEFEDRSQHWRLYYLEVISLNNNTLDKSHDYKPPQDEHNSDYRETAKTDIITNYYQQDVFSTQTEFRD